MKKLYFASLAIVGLFVVGFVQVPVTGATEVEEHPVIVTGLKVIVYVGDSQYSTTANWFANAYEAVGGNVTVLAAYNFSNILTDNPDAVFLADIQSDTNASDSSATGNITKLYDWFKTGDKFLFIAGNSDFGGAYNAANATNPLLKAFGSQLRVDAGAVEDDTMNDGAAYRVVANTTGPSSTEVDYVFNDVNFTAGMPFHGPTSVFGWSGGKAVDLRNTTLSWVDVIVNASGYSNALDQDSSATGYDFHTSNKSFGISVYGLSFSNITIKNVNFTDGRTYTSLPLNGTLTNANATDSFSPLATGAFDVYDVLVNGYFNGTFANGTEIRGNFLNASIVLSSGMNTSEYIEYNFNTGNYPLLVTEEFYGYNSTLAVAGESIFSDYKNMYGLTFEKSGEPHAGMEVLDRLIAFHFTSVAETARDTAQLVFQRETNTETETVTETTTVTSSVTETATETATVTATATATATVTNTVTTTAAGSVTTTTVGTSFALFATLISVAVIGFTGLFIRHKRKRS